MEELILIEPINHIYHLKYAEILYSLGNMDISMKEFCRVIELCPNHVRAFYGVHLCTRKLLLDCNETERKLLTDLNVFASKHLNTIYQKEAGPSGSKILEDYLTSSFKA
ncbi:Inositol phosphatase SIW14 [Entomophthora muscae]|uniref:Inositol phosphatase SIW14 n=1 Tax=Entomophthora muscae TaxID=34485 RepID=A0ACC2UGH3_9FUNG|nr:Inositol phosphatase SIW14 [Entomophthora muscae]